MNYNFFESLDTTPGAAQAGMWGKYTPAMAEPPVFSGLLKKHGKDSKDPLSVRFFILGRKHLLYKKSEDSAEIAAALPIEFARIVYPDIDETDVTPAEMIKDKYPIKICLRNKFSILYATSKEELIRWQNALTVVALRTDFHTRYSVSKILGNGAFANVYETTNKETGHRFATKGFNKHFLESDTKGKRSLWNEISVLRLLDHKNLLRLHEVHETKNSVYLVFDIYEGGELSKIYEGTKGLPQATVQAVMSGLIRGINNMQENGIVHRDLKPGNIMLRKCTDITPEDVVIVDFGLATSVKDTNPIFKRCGTPGYIAPEIINAKNTETNFKVSPNCDIFSLGVIVYCLCTGGSPFELPGLDVDQILRKNLECKVDFSGPAFSKYSAELLRITKGMLQVDSAKRIKTKAILSSPVCSPEDTHDMDYGTEMEEFQSNEHNDHLPSIKPLSRAGPGSNHASSDKDNDSIGFGSTKAIAVKEGGKHFKPATNLYKQSLLGGKAGSAKVITKNQSEADSKSHSGINHFENVDDFEHGLSVDSPKSADGKVQQLNMGFGHHLASGKVHQTVAGNRKSVFANHKESDEAGKHLDIPDSP